MKIKLTIVILTLISATLVMAIYTIPFPGWDWLKEKSPDIVIARCSRTPKPGQDQGAGPTGTLVYSDVEIISILKGATNWGTEPLEAPKLGASKLSSEYWPRQGEYYLIFSIYNNGCYQANEDYRVIPFGIGTLIDSITNAITGKPLDEQLQILFKRRLDNLNLQMQAEQKEKQRLEEGLQK